MQDHIQFDSAKICLNLLDQRYLPNKQEIFPCTNTQTVIYALQEMVVRGAPAIGVTAAFGAVLAANETLQKFGQGADSAVWQKFLQARLAEIAEARPTAVNLAWAVKRMQALWQKEQPGTLQALITLWLAEALHMQSEDIAINKKMGANGAELIADGDCVMTHCNAGALATAGYGTALGVIYAAFEAGKKVTVITNETRPFLQGARLSAYELLMQGVPVTIACDNACALLMQKGLVQKVVVGADRIAANGDAANKIGTYGVALLAKAHNIPFYVAAPLSTIDRNTKTGQDIPIEQRPSSEVTHMGGVQITPAGVPVYNFAFDVTPNELIAGIVTEMGVLKAPYEVSIAEAFTKAEGKH